MGRVIQDIPLQIMFQMTPQYFSSPRLKQQRKSHGIRNSYGNKFFLSLCSFSTAPSGDNNTSGFRSSFRAQNSERYREGGSMTNPLFKSAILSPEKGLRYASSYKSEHLKLFYRNSSSSNEALNDGKVSQVSYGNEAYA